MIYERRVEQVAHALHEDCALEWRAIAAVDPNRQITMHTDAAHYGQAHNLVRRIWPELDTAGPEQMAVRAAVNEPPETSA